MEPRNWRKPIGEILLEKKLLTPEKLQEALELQKQRPGEKLGQILVKLGYVSKKDILRAYTEQLGMLYENANAIDTD